MPNPAHSGIHGDPWYHCEICGWEYHTSQLTRQPGLRRGLLVCPKCFDNPLTFYRDLLIQDALSFSADEEMAVADILKIPLSDDSNQF